MNKLSVCNYNNSTDPNLEQFIYVFQDAKQRDWSRRSVHTKTHTQHIQYYLTVGWADMRDMNTVYVSDYDEKIRVDGGGIYLVYDKITQMVSIEIIAGWSFVRWKKTMHIKDFSRDILDEFESFFDDVYPTLKNFNDAFYEHQKELGKTRSWFLRCRQHIFFENNTHVKIVVDREEDLRFPFESYIKLEDFTQQKAREALEMWDLWNLTCKTEGQWISGVYYPW